MAAGMCPLAMPALLEAARGRASFAATNYDDGGDDDVVCLGGSGDGGGGAGSGSTGAAGGAARNDGGGRMSGVVGEVCVELRKFYIEVWCDDDDARRELRCWRWCVGWRVPALLRRN